MTLAERIKDAVRAFWAAYEAANDSERDALIRTVREPLGITRGA